MNLPVKAWVGLVAGASLLMAMELFSGCSTSPANGDGGTDGTSNPDVATQPDSGTDSGTDAAVVYCDGMELKNAAGADVYLIMYPPSADIATACTSLYVPNDAGPPTFPTDGTSFGRVGGIWDSYTSAATPPFNGVLPGACDDMGIGSGPNGGTFTTPDAGTNVVTAVASAMAADGGTFSTSLYGVVTFVSPWGTSNGTAFGGQIYIQDPAVSSPAPRSGIDVYFAPSLVGGSALPTAIPKRGDVVMFTNVTWSPYKGVNQFTYNASSTTVALGTSPLPVAVPLQATDLASGNTAADQWKGMRVVDVESFTVLSNCPVNMQYSGG